jgi:adenine-specific DNA-methyltransferase
MNIRYYDRKRPELKMTGFSENKTYVVQTGQKVIQRCLLMTTDPGDLVLDPTTVT